MSFVRGEVLWVSLIPGPFWKGWVSLVSGPFQVGYVQGGGYVQGWVCPGGGYVQWLPGKSRGGYVWELGMSVGIFRGEVGDEYPHPRSWDLGYSEIRSASRRYACCWNAFLFTYDNKVLYNNLTCNTTLLEKYWRSIDAIESGRICNDFAVLCCYIDLSFTCNRAPVKMLFDSQLFFTYESDFFHNFLLFVSD